MMRIGLYGCGGRTRGVVTTTLENKVDCKVTRCYDRNPETAALAARQFGGKACSKAELLGSDEVDMLFISLFPAAHAEALLEAAETRKPIYIEKPVVTNRRDLVRLAPLAAREDLHIQVGSMCGYIPIYKQLDALVKQGALGKLISGTFHWASLRDFAAAADFSSNWRHAPETGGELTQHLCHYFGWMRTVAGDFESLMAMCTQDPENKSCIEDSWTVILKFRGGALFDVKQCERDRSHTVLGTLEGTEGAVHWEWQYDKKSSVVHFPTAGKWHERAEGKELFTGPIAWEDPAEGLHRARRVRPRPVGAIGRRPLGGRPGAPRPRELRRREAGGLPPDAGGLRRCLSLSRPSGRRWRTCRA